MLISNAQKKVSEQGSAQIIGYNKTVWGNAAEKMSADTNRGLSSSSFFSCFYFAFFAMSYFITIVASLELRLGCAKIYLLPGVYFDLFFETPILIACH